MLFLYTLDRYIGKKFLKHVIFFSGTAFLFVALIEFLELYRKASHKLVSGLIQHAFLKTPHTLYTFMPLLLFFTAMFTLYFLHKKGEITTLRTHGVSSLRLVTPLFVLGFLCGLGNLFLLHPVGVLGMRSYLSQEKADNNVASNTNLQLFRSGLWAKRKKDNKIFLLHAQKPIYRHNTQLKKPTLHITDNQNTTQEIWHAKEGWLLNKKLFLRNAWHFHQKKGLHFFNEKVLTCPISLPELISQAFHPTLLYFWSLNRLMHVLEDMSLAAYPYYLMWQKMLASLLDTSFLVLIGALLGMQHRQRQSNTLLCIATVGGGFLFYALQHILFQLGKAEQVPFFISVWFFTLVLVGVSSILILMLEEGKRVHT